MSPLAFKRNNLQLMRRTTLPDTAFERVDKFLSNECIHTSVPLSNSVVTGFKPKVVRFLRVQISDRFRQNENTVLSSLYRSIAFIVICELRTRYPGPTKASIIFSSHWSLCSKQPPRLAMHPFRRFVKACMALATRCWEIWAQQNLRRSFRLSTSWIFTAHQPLHFSSSPQTKNYVI